MCVQAIDGTGQRIHSAARSISTKATRHVTWDRTDDLEISTIPILPIQQEMQQNRNRRELR